MREKKYILLISMILVIGLMGGLCLAQISGVKQQRKKEQEPSYRIGFHFWKPGKIYDESMEGIKDALELEGIVYEAIVFHSDRDKLKAIENLKELDAMKLDLIYSLSSAGTLIAKELGMKTPVIATVVNHPISLGLNQEDIGSFIKLTGTSYYIDAHKQLNLYLELFPKTTKIGMLYDSQNPAGYLAEEPFMKRACDSLGKKFHSVGVQKKSDLAEATEKLIKNGVEIIVIPTNSLVYSNLKTVLEITHKNSIPVLSMNKQGVEYGALAGLFADNYKLGRLTGSIAKKILENKKNPPHIPFIFVSQPDLILNLQEAYNLGYEFPVDVLGRAAIVL